MDSLVDHQQPPIQFACGSLVVGVGQTSPSLHPGPAAGPRHTSPSLRPVLAAGPRPTRTGSGPTKAEKHAHLQMGSVAETDFVVGFERCAQVGPGRSRLPRSLQVLPYSNRAMAPSLAHLMTPHAAGANTLWWKPPSQPPSPLAALPWPPHPTLKPSVPCTVATPPTLLARTSLSHVETAMSRTRIRSPRAEALASAITTHGPELVKKMQTPAYSVMVAVHGEKNVRIPLCHLATQGVDASVLQDKNAARVALKVDHPHGNVSVIPAVPIVETGQPSDGLFFFRPGMRVVGLALATYKNMKWDGLYDISDFSDDEISKVFGASWLSCDVGMRSLQTNLGETLASSSIVYSGQFSRAVPTCLPGATVPAIDSLSRILGASALPEDWPGASHALSSTGTTGKRKAAALTSHDAPCSYASVASFPGTLLQRLQRYIPALLAASQDLSSTTVIAWPFVPPTLDGSGNREALSVIARRGMSADQFSHKSAREIASLTLQRARAGNAKSGTGAYPVIPVFSDGYYSPESVICQNYGRDVIDIGVLFKRNGEMWKKGAIAVPLSSLTSDHLALLFDTSDDLLKTISEYEHFSSSSAWGVVRGTSDAGGDATDDEDGLELAHLLQHVQGSVVAPLTPLSPVPRMRRCSSSASTLDSRYGHVRAAMAAYGPALLAASGGPSATAQISFRQANGHAPMPLNCAVRAGVSLPLLAGCDFDMTTLVVRRVRCGNVPGGPFPIFPVTEPSYEEPPLFAIGVEDSMSEHLNVYDLALAVKGVSGWRGADLVSLQRLSDDQLDELFGCETWSSSNGGLAATPSFKEVSNQARFLPHTTPLAMAPAIRCATLPLVLTEPQIRLLVRAAQAGSSSTMIKVPGSSDVSALCSVARSGVKLSQLDSSSTGQEAHSLLLATVGMGRSNPIVGVFPVVPLLEDQQCAAAHGVYNARAAIALKHPDKASSRWRDRSVCWVDVQSLSPKQTSVLISAARRLEEAELASASDGADSENFDATCISSKPSGLCDTGVEKAACSFAGSSTSVPGPSFYSERVELLHSDFFLRARALGVVPEDPGLSSRLNDLLLEAIEAGVRVSGS